MGGSTRGGAGCVPRTRGTGLAVDDKENQRQRVFDSLEGLKQALEECDPAALNMTDWYRVEGRLSVLEKQVWMTRKLRSR